MLPWETLASVATPEGALELRRRSAHDVLITIGGRVLMASATSRSEVELARLGCEGLREVPKARVLVSGLGLGFTLRAALDALAPDAEVHVAELNPVVVEWCSGPVGYLTEDAVKDPRVTVEVVDVSRFVARRAENGPRFDAIVLDMYEGPQPRPRDDDPLYGRHALVRTRSALKPGGRLAIWCESVSTGFERALGQAGFDFRVKRAGRGAKMFLVYLCTPRPKR